MILLTDNNKKIKSLLTLITSKLDVLMSSDKGVKIILHHEVRLLSVPSTHENRPPPAHLGHRSPRGWRTAEVECTSLSLLPPVPALQGARHTARPSRSFNTAATL